MKKKAKKALQVIQLLLTLAQKVINFFGGNKDSNKDISDESNTVESDSLKES